MCDCLKLNFPCQVISIKSIILFGRPLQTCKSCPLGLSRILNTTCKTLNSLSGYSTGQIQGSREIDDSTRYLVKSVEWAPDVPDLLSSKGRYFSLGYIKKNFKKLSFNFELIAINIQLKIVPLGDYDCFSVDHHFWFIFGQYLQQLCI